MQSSSGAEPEQQLKTVANAGPLIPKEGFIVYGRVNKVEDRFCRIDILAIEEKPLPANTHFTGIIFKENVRDYDRDNIKMYKCFVANDIVKAKVIQEA